MRNHVRMKHSITFAAVVTPKRKLKVINPIDSCFKMKDPVDVFLAELISYDGLPFRVFSTSQNLRTAVEEQGYKLPKEAKSIKGLLMKHYEDIKKTYQQQRRKEDCWS